MNLQALGDKLQRYRIQLQRTVDEVAAFTAINVERLSSIEKGVLEPTGDEVLILADYYRCDFKFFISNEQVAPFEQTETLYRAHGREFSKEDRSAIQEFLYICETEEFLTQELRGAASTFAYTPRGSYFLSHAEGAAKAFRRQMGHTDREVPETFTPSFAQSVCMCSGES